MRYIWGSLGILLCITALTVCNSRHMTAVTTEAMALLETARSDYTTCSEQIEEATALETFWESKRTYLESVVMHDDLEEIGTTLSNLISAALCDDNDDYQAAGRLLEKQLEHVEKMEKLRFGNVL